MCAFGCWGMPQYKTEWWFITGCQNKIFGTYSFMNMSVNLWKVYIISSVHAHTKGFKCVIVCNLRETGHQGCKCVCATKLIEYHVATFLTFYACMSIVQVCFFWSFMRKFIPHGASIMSKYWPLSTWTISIFLTMLFTLRKQEKALILSYISDSFSHKCFECCRLLFKQWLYQ